MSFHVHVHASSYTTTAPRTASHPVMASFLSIHMNAGERSKCTCIISCSCSCSLFWSRATDMNYHVPYKIRDINDKAIFEKRQIHTVLSIFFEDCLSGPTRMDLSQSIKNPSSSEIVIFSALISRCRMFASKYAASWAIKWDMSTLNKHGQEQTNLAWHLQWQ